MRLLYILIGLGLIAGLGVGAREYAIKRGWIPEQSNNQQSIGKKDVAITAPSESGLPLGMTSYVVSGRTTPNATEVKIELYEYGNWGSWPVGTLWKKTSEFTVSKFKLGDTRWTATVSPVKGDLQSTGKVTRHELRVRATFSDGTTQTVKRTVHWQFAAPAKQ
jgi:hypothetical protein